MTPRKYAEGTEVSVARTREEMLSTITRHGGDQIGFQFGSPAMIGFRVRGRFVKFTIPAPDEKALQRTPTGQRRGDKDHRAAIAREEMRLWRAVLLMIRAKFEAVESGLSTFDHEFLAAIVLPDGQTVGEWAGPQLELAYSSGAMPSSLLALPAPSGGSKR